MIRTPWICILDFRATVVRMPRVLPISVISMLVPIFLSACSNSLGPVGHGQSRSVKSGYIVTRNINYTPKNWPEAVRGDFYRPKSAEPVPAVLLIHGGGWTGSDGRWQMAPIARILAKRGYAVLNVTYRLAPRWIYPAPVEDLQEAVKWLRANAAEQGIDPNRIATFGYSAGGYLAALTGLIEGAENSNIRAIVAGGAPSDLTFYPGGDLVPQFLGGKQQEIPWRFSEASPVNYVTPDSPPMFLYHGTNDRLVPPEHAQVMISELKQKGVPHEYFWMTGRSHISGFLLPGGSVNAAVNFLDRQMK